MRFSIVFSSSDTCLFPSLTPVWLLSVGMGTKGNQGEPRGTNANSSVYSKLRALLLWACFYGAFRSSPICECVQ